MVIILINLPKNIRDKYADMSNTKSLFKKFKPLKI